MANKNIDTNVSEMQPQNDAIYEAAAKFVNECRRRSLRDPLSSETPGSIDPPGGFVAVFRPGTARAERAKPRRRCRRRVGNGLPPR